jgi:hypothetical protein
MTALLIKESVNQTMDNMLHNALNAQASRSTS